MRTLLLALLLACSPAMANEPPPEPPPTPAPADPKPPEPRPKRQPMIPRARFDEVYNDYMELKAWRREHEPRLSEIDGHASQLEALKAAHAEELVAARMGLDEEGLEAARFYYDRAHRETADKDKPGFTDWLKGFGDDNPAPRGLQPFLSGLDTGGGTKRPPDTSRGKQPGPPSADAVWTDDQVEALIKRCQESGDWTEYEKVKHQIRRRR
jgi:hypothetical protein